MPFQIEKLLKSYRKAELIFRQNTPGQEMYIIYSGRVDLMLERAEGGGETSLANFGPGDFFGEMALIDGAPRSAAAIAAEDNTRLIVLDRAKLAELFRHQPEVGVLMIETLCRRIRAMNESMARAKSQAGA